MIPPVNYLAVLVCGIVSMIIGSLWYGPIFGKQWMALMGITPEKMAEQKQKGKSAMFKSYGLMFVGSLIMAFVLSHALVFGNAYLKTSGLSAGLMVGFFNWLGFIAPVTLGSILWEGQSLKLWILNNRY